MEKKKHLFNFLANRVVNNANAKPGQNPSAHTIPSHLQQSPKV